MEEYGLQLYSVRDALKTDLPGTLKKVAELGYKAVEFAGFFGYPAKKIKDILDKTGLKVWGSHTGLDELTDDKINATIDYMKTVGNTDIVIPCSDIATRSAQNFVIDRINKIMPVLKKEGITLSYHNHTGEFIKRPFVPFFFTRLLKETSCFFEIDTFWLFNAGYDPCAFLDKYPDRIKLIHLKDGFVKKPFKKAVGKSLGEGQAPVEKVLDSALIHGYKVIVESETQLPDGISEVKRCMDHLRSLKFDFD